MPASQTNPGYTGSRGGATTPPASIEDDLKAYALQLGLDLVGIAGAGAFAELGETLRQRAARGLYPPFTETDIEHRIEPDRWLPGARALISVGVSYLVDDGAAGGAATAAGGPRGLLSRYCRGEDYHRLLHEQLAQMATWLDQRLPGHRHAAFVDTGPAADRAVAARAGLGWFGRHTNLITASHGSWVLWGELATTAPLTPDPPFAGDCGHCRRCVDACPTGAILDLEGTLDAQRCLSFVTQLRGPIPMDQRAPLGNLIFGCDICQDACPYNHQVRAGNHPQFRPRPELGAEPDLAALLRMTKGRFRRWFGGTAASWRGSLVLRRNAVVALGNSGDRRALSLLGEALADRHPLIRGHAAWSLARLAAQLGAGTVERVRAALADRRADESDVAVLAEIAAALDSLAPESEPVDTPSPGHDLMRIGQ